MLEVDLKRKRVGLSMRLTDEVRRGDGDHPGQQRAQRETPVRKPKPAREQTREKGGTAMSAAFAKLRS